MPFFKSINRPILNAFTVRVQTILEPGDIEAIVNICLKL